MSQELVERLRGEHRVRRVCQVLGVPRSSYYARRRRPEPARVQEDRHLKQKILAVHAAASGRYGTPRIERQLRRQGVATSRRRVARLRCELGLKAKSTRRYRQTTDSRHSYPVAPNLLSRRFEAYRPDQIWVGDITFLTAGPRWLYLAVLMDVFSRRIVGWALSERMDEALTLKALSRALRLRQPPRGVIHHSDRGGQYCSNTYRDALDTAGIVASMSRVADCWDNAMAESLIKTIKTELGRSFASHSSPTRSSSSTSRASTTPAACTPASSTRPPSSRAPRRARTVRGRRDLWGARALTATVARDSTLPQPQIS